MFLKDYKIAPFSKASAFNVALVAIVGSVCLSLPGCGGGTKGTSVVATRVHGNVTDADGAAKPGVPVTVEGAEETVETQTNQSGNYELTIANSVDAHFLFTIEGASTLVEIPSQIPSIEVDLKQTDTGELVATVHPDDPIAADTEESAPEKTVGEDAGSTAPNENGNDTKGKKPTPPSEDPDEGDTCSNCTEPPVIPSTLSGTITDETGSGIGGIHLGVKLKDGALSQWLEATYTATSSANGSFIVEFPNALAPTQIMRIFLFLPDGSALGHFIVTGVDFEPHFKINAQGDVSLVSTRPGEDYNVTIETTPDIPEAPGFDNHGGFSPSGKSPPTSPGDGAPESPPGEDGPESEDPEPPGEANEGAGGQISVGSEGSSPHGATL